MNDFRQMALALPGAVEKDHFGAPSFRVDDKIFAQLSADGNAALVKLPLEVQASLVLERPKDCRPEEHWGRYGWTRLCWRNFEVDFLKELLETSFLAVQPRRKRGSS